MSTSSRFAKYLSPHLGSIVLAVVCALVISLCDAGYGYIFGYTVEAITLIATQRFEDGPIQIRYFHLEKFINGLEITITDATTPSNLLAGY